MFKVNKRRVLALILSVVIVLSITACSGRPEQASDGASVSSVSSNASSTSSSGGAGRMFANPLPIPSKASTKGVVDTGFMSIAQEKHEINSDTVGWLNVPGTSIDDVIVWYPGDYELLLAGKEAYYLRRDFDKVVNPGTNNATRFGTYYADFECSFNGGWQGLSRNTTIYGHSMTDNPEDKAFSQLKKLLDEDFAKKTPYIYFSTTDEDLAWEIFAVFYTKIDLEYILPNMTDEQFKEIVIDGVLPRSIYNYDGEVTKDDKILTLSTCCYGFTSSYPNDYRYVVMAKLVPTGKATKTEAVFTKNPSPQAP